MGQHTTAEKDPLVLKYSARVLQSHDHDREQMFRSLILASAAAEIKG
jgi:hypothetical protein